jgi:hypothetical protein
LFSQAGAWMAVVRKVSSAEGRQIARGSVHACHCVQCSGRGRGHGTLYHVVLFAKAASA